MLRTNLDLKYSQNKGNVRGLNASPASFPASENHCMLPHRHTEGTGDRLGGSSKTPSVARCLCRKTLHYVKGEEKGEEKTVHVISAV